VNQANMIERGNAIHNYEIHQMNKDPARNMVQPSFLAGSYLRKENLFSRQFFKEFLFKKKDWRLRKGSKTVRIVMFTKAVFTGKFWPCEFSEGTKGADRVALG